MCATAAIFEVFIQNLQISKWRKISKIGLLQECRVLQIHKIPKKLNGRELKPSLNMAQEISWSVSLRTAIIFGLVCLKYQRVHFRAAVGALEKKKSYFILKERL